MQLSTTFLMLEKFRYLIPGWLPCSIGWCLINCLQGYPVWGCLCFVCMFAWMFGGVTSWNWRWQSSWLFPNLQFSACSITWYLIECFHIWSLLLRQISSVKLEMLLLSTTHLVHENLVTWSLIGCFADWHHETGDDATAHHSPHAGELMLPDAGGQHDRMAPRLWPHLARPGLADRAVPGQGTGGCQVPCELSVLIFVLVLAE